MPNFNCVTLAGHLTRDVETRSFANGGMVAKFGLAVNNRKKNPTSGQWEDVPVFIDCEVFNRGENGKTADIVRDYCKKGSAILIRGKLDLDQWQDKATGANRSKHKVIVDEVQLLGGKGERQTAARPAEATPETMAGPPTSDSDIPFSFLLAMAATTLSMMV